MFLQVSVIHSVHRGGGGLPQCMLGYHPPRIRHHPPRPGRHPPRTRQTPPGQADTPPGPGRPLADTPPRPGRPPRDQADTPPREAHPSIRCTSGRYASYWNAVLCQLFLLFWQTRKKPTLYFLETHLGNSWHFADVWSQFHCHTRHQWIFFGSFIHQLPNSNILPFQLRCSWTPWRPSSTWRWRGRRRSYPDSYWSVLISLLQWIS